MPPRCPRLGVGRVPRGVVNPPRVPRGRGEGSYEGRKSFEEKMCDEKNEKMQKTRVWRGPPRLSINGKLRLDVGNIFLPLPGPGDLVKGSL